MTARSFARRHELVTQMRHRLLRAGAPRLQLGAIVALCGCCAFVVSVVGLRLGVASMAVRYPLAVVGGYLAFLLLIRSWIAWQRRAADPAGGDFVADLAAQFVDVTDLSVARPASARSGPSLFTAGRSGGAGGGGQWSHVVSPASQGGSASSGKGFMPDLDLDDLWFVVLAAVCALGGFVAIAYVVYAAPLMLAEVALDAAVVSAVYRRMRRQDASHWAVTVLKHTWIPALILVICAALGGYALQRIAPDARSIGGVFNGDQPSAIGDQQ
jgi:hypothetical protein